MVMDWPPLPAPLPAEDHRDPAEARRAQEGAEAAHALATEEASAGE